jgi:hypothetical protein
MIPILNAIVECQPERSNVTGCRPYADFLCALAAGFFAAASFAGFLPAIGISISF